MSVPSVYDRNPESWKLLVKERIDNIGKLRTPFFWSVTKIFVFGYLQTSQLCIVGELAG